MFTENTNAGLKVGGRLNQSLQGPHFALPGSGISKDSAPMIDGAMELRAAMQLNANPSLRQYSSAVQFCFRNGCMVMAGMLPSYFLKQLAQESVRCLEGIEAIDNRIYVESTYDSEPLSSNPVPRVVPR